MKNAFILSAVTCLFFWNCKSKDYPLDDLPADRITFGEGGGFTGQYTDWMLLDSGQILERKGIGGDFVQIKKIKRKEVRQLYEKAAALSAEVMQEKPPGNYNYSLTVQRDSTELKATWSGQSPIAPEVEELYKSLRAQAKGVAVENK